MAKGVRRSTEEIVADLDAKIAKHEENIASLKAKKEAALNPKARVSKNAAIKAALDEVKGSLTPEEIAEALKAAAEKKAKE
ncbi:hypothetical protein [Sinanaerobacter sp. ZZT-01]|uniref:hypothetical protein n=1 Tax=Sinanaerobacter sp. ZZT-01 TaxID=3111540 RepID=UPI002D77CF41|nr:hypothetical protein [Sinanaerobacter sp. ZZT-01]WRR92709.1 hypothetical protein U5921_11730 [Sinanaerobacter sp. ZZT-01]